MYACSMMIPSDIITQILCRLPAKSLSRFRSVSKGWLSLITDPKFIKTHRVTLNRNHLIFHDRHHFYSHPFHHHDPFMFKPTKLPIESMDRCFSITFKGSCDGLVLVLLSESDNVLVLFNPTTRESVQLPPAAGCYPHHLRNHSEESVHSTSTYGIGYDSVTDDYKVITLTHFDISVEDDPDRPYYFRRVNWVHSTSVRVSIYSLRSNTWRQLFIDDCPYKFRDIPCHLFHAVHVNGFLHWFATKNDTDVLVAFSLVDECFREVPSPDFCNVDTKIKMSDWNCQLIVLGGKLAIYVMPWEDWPYVKFEAWLMNEYGVKESWIKIPLDIFHDDFYMTDSMIFDDNGKIRVATINGHMLIYDFEKRSLSRSVYIWSRRFRLFGSYVESLVSPKRKDDTANAVEQILDSLTKTQSVGSKASEAASGTSLDTHHSSRKGYDPGKIPSEENLDPMCHPYFCNKSLRFAKIMNDKKASLRKKEREERKAKLKEHEERKAKLKNKRKS